MSSSDSDGPPTVPDATAQASIRAMSLARYALGDVIGKGGMGEVLSATDSQLGRAVAVKRMKHASPTVQSMTRFFREAMVQGRLDHPAIVPVYEVGVDDHGRPFFVMKKLAGTTLAQKITDRASREPLLRAFVDVCLAVDLAHSRSIVHRDLKPANVMLGDYGEVYVLDWGIARVLDDSQDISSDGADEDAETAAGTRIGTYGYMAPEQTRDARSVDHRADIYSLGCVLFEILARETLHPRGPLALETTLAGIDARPSLRGIEVPPELEALCVTATALDPADRMQSARELATGVQRFLDGDRDLARRRELALVHFEAARTAFESGDAARATAMREAGSALALDPSLTAAAELVARLMLEPPKTMPSEVVQEVERLDKVAEKRNSRYGATAFGAFLLFLPLLFGGQLTPLTIALIACVALSCALLLLDIHAPWATFTNIILVAVLARMFSPFYIAPGIAAVITLALVFSPSYKTRRATAAISFGMLMAIIVPWLAEHLGFLSPTMALATGRVTFTGSDIQLSPMMGLIGQIGYISLLILAAAWLGHSMWTTQRNLRQALHLQTWQLGQLVQPARR